MLKHNYGLLMADRLNRILILMDLVVFVVFLSICVILWTRFPPQLPLYYSFPWGKDQIGTPLELLGVLTGSQIFALFNIGVALFTAPKHPFFGRILVAGGVGCVVLTAITVAKIILLVL